ncbi:DUF4912 domain-containing protein [Cylindrospermum sp. FACHB-282]|nr:DUF4912 domain-containing protein [Cylindrospermum sp. FACHB-282]
MSPDDPKYPFSQYLVYVYKQNPSPSVGGFLGFTLAPPGKKAIEEARAAEASAIASSVLQKFTTANQPTSPTETAPVATASPIEALPGVTVSPTETAPVATNREQLRLPAENNSVVERDTPLWLLLPLFVVSIGGILLWWFLKRRPLSDGETDSLAESTSSPSIAATDDPSIAFPLNNGNGTQTNGKSHLTEDTNSTVSNVIEDITANKAATAKGGTSILSAFAAKSSHTAVTNTATVSSTAEIISLDSGEVAWDIEAPVAVVNTSYPQMPNISELAADTKPATNEETDSLPELPDIETDSFSELLEMPEEALNLELATAPETDSLSELLEIPEEALNLELATESEPETDSFSELLEMPEEALNLELATAPEADSFSELLEMPEEALNLELATAPETDSFSELLEMPEEALNLELATAPETDSFSELLEMPEEALNLELATAPETDSFSELLEIPEEALNLELATAPETDSFSELLEIPEEALNLELATAPETDSFSELLEIPEEALNLELATAPETDSFSELLEIPEEALNLELATAPETDSFSELLEMSEEALNLELATETETETDSFSELLEMSEEALNLELATAPETDSASELLEMPEEALNVIADEAEPTANLTEKISQVLPTPEDNIAKTVSKVSEVTAEDVALAAGTSIGTWATGYELKNNLDSEAEGQTNTEEFANLSDANNVSSRVVLTPRTPKWAYVSWYVSETQKKALRQQGDSLLAVRLYDVTDIDLSYQSPHLIQQYECEEATHDRYVAIPAGDRDYMIEIGYATKGDRWLPIARSVTVRIFTRPHTDFWFVADTELIIHGATEPDAKVSIDGHPIKLKQDGTFHLRIPFSDKLIDYLITASAANGKQTKTIHKKYSQDTSDS